MPLLVFVVGQSAGWPDARVSRVMTFPSAIGTRRNALVVRITPWVSVHRLGLLIHPRRPERAGSVLQKLSSLIRQYVDKAAQCRTRADASRDDPVKQREFLLSEQRWNSLARFEDFQERLDRFLRNQSVPTEASAAGGKAPSTHGRKRDRSDSVCRKQLISIVEDDTGVREALKGFILSLGYAANTFATAEEYLKSGLLHDTACLICDVGLPGMSGPDLQVRLIAEGYRIPVVFVTGAVSNNLRARVLAAGAVGCLAKPLAPGG